MKKKIGILTLIALTIASFASAGVNVVSEGTFFGSGTGADVVIPKEAGTISDDNVYLSIATNATVTIHRASAYANASVASASTSITIPTTVTNTVGGILITTDDFVIVGTQLRAISAITPASATSTVLTVATTAVALNEKVYIADNANIVQFAALTTHTDPLPNVFTGFRDNPVAVSVPAGAGATLVSGRYSIKR